MALQRRRRLLTPAVPTHGHDMAVTVYYDGDCPFCTRYVQGSFFVRPAGDVS